MCSASEGGRLGIVTDPKVVSLHEQEEPRKQATLVIREDQGKMGLGVKGEVSKVSTNSGPVQCLEDQAASWCGMPNGRPLPEPIQSH